MLLAVIGKRWATEDNGARSRLDDPKDFVRLEISTALARDVRVIPVLVDGMTMPTEETLPTSLKALARRNAMEISNTRFDFDVDRLITAVRSTLDEAEAKLKADEEKEKNRAQQEAERRRFEAETQRKAEEELHREEERKRSEEEAKRKAEAEEQRRSEEERNRAEQEAERRRLEAEAQRKAEEEASSGRETKTAWRCFSRQTERRLRGTRNGRRPGRHV